MVVERGKIVLRLAVLGTALACAGVVAGAAPAAGFSEPVNVIAELHGDSQNTSFGWAVSELGDVTGDGVGDAIVAEPGAGPASEGSAKVYSGATGALVRRFDGSAGGDQLGYAIADAGDANGDGVHDVLAGAPAFPGAPVPGYVDLYSGADGSLLHRFVGLHAGDRFGAAVAGAGDVDRDGRADVLVGAPSSGAGGANSGRAYVYSGRTYDLIRKLDAGGRGDLFGTAVDSTADLNGDRIPDELVGARNAGPARQGVVYAFSGANGRPLWQVGTPPTGQDLGWFFVAGVGDVNGDGIPDVFGGDFDDASLDTPGTGRAAVYSGVDGHELQSWVGAVAGEGLGPGREAGDVDGDGRPDLAIGSYTSSDGAPFAGKVQIFSGATGALLRTITSTTAGEQFGFDAVGIGDVNGDGRPDLLVGAAGLGNAYILAGD